MRKVYFILVVIMLVCIGCQWQLRPDDKDTDVSNISVQRYDRIESLYLTTGDFAALQQLNTYFPEQTRMLLEDVLHLGQVNDADINTKFLYFFQDSILQRMLTDVQQQYADMDDINEELSEAFSRLHEEFPKIEMPDIYAQIGSFDQSIIVGTGMLGISLEKYLGEDYPFYQDHYGAEQRSLMKRSMIVPDCLAFFILSQFPLSHAKQGQQQERDWHMGKIQWAVNQLMGSDIFTTPFVQAVEEYMKQHPKTSLRDLLENSK